MRTKVTLILVFLNVALFFFIFYVRPHWVTVDQLKAARSSVLPATASDIQSIEITTATQNTRLVKKGEVWHIEKPIDWPANQHAVERILTELQLLKHKTAFDVSSLAQNKLSLADYGLDKPVLSLSLTPRPNKAEGSSQTPERLTLLIGNPTNVGNRLYVLSPDRQRVHVVDQSLADSINIPLDQLRSQSLFTIPEYEASFLSIQISDSNQRVYVRRDANRWTLDSPVTARANAAAVRQAITLLNGLRVAFFVTQPPPPESNPGSAALVRISLGGNNRSETLLIGGLASGEGGTASPNTYYAQLDDKKSIFTITIPQDLMDNLRSAQVKLRETRLFEFEPRQVTSVILKVPNRDATLTLQRLEPASPEDSATWQIVRRTADGTPLTQAADTAAVQQLVETLSRFSVQRFLRDAYTAADLEAWGFNSPEREIVISSSSDQPGQHLQGAAASAPVNSVQTLQIGVGTERGAKAYAKLDSARYVYEVDSEILRETSMDPLAWRDRKVRALPAGARIVSIRITDLSNQKVLLERKAQGDAPDALIPAEAKPEQVKAWNVLLGQLRQLKAKTFLAEHYSDTFNVSGEPRTWRFKLEAGIELTSGAAAAHGETQTLLLSERLGGTVQAAGAQDLDSLFTIEQPLIDALWTLTQGSVLVPAANDAQKP
jgi:hypothetical protein